MSYRLQERKFDYWQVARPRMYLSFINKDFGSWNVKIAVFKSNFRPIMGGGQVYTGCSTEKYL